MGVNGADSIEQVHVATNVQAAFHQVGSGSQVHIGVTLSIHAKAIKIQTASDQVWVAVAFPGQFQQLTGVGQARFTHSGGTQSEVEVAHTKPTLEHRHTGFGPQVVGAVKCAQHAFNVKVVAVQGVTQREGRVASGGGQPTQTRQPNVPVVLGVQCGVYRYRCGRHLRLQGQAVDLGLTGACKAPRQQASQKALTVLHGRRFSRRA